MRFQLPISSRLLLPALTCFALVASALQPAPACAQLSYTEIAREWTGGLGWIDGNVAPALAENGQVVFAAQSTMGAEGIYRGSGGVH